MTAGTTASTAGTTARTAIRPPGRPRNPDVDRAILDATLQLLGDVGYQAMSIAAVASEAGVGRAAVYRRYASKAELVVAAIVRLTAGPDPELPRGTRAALHALLRSTATALGAPGGMAILGSLLAQERRDPELLAAFRERIFDPRHVIVHDVLRRGIEAGKLPADTDLEAVDGLLFGGLLARAILGEPADDEWIERTIRQAWRGIAGPARPVSHPVRRTSK